MKKFFLSLCVAIAVAGCSESSKEETVYVASVSPATVTLKEGGTAILTVNVTPELYAEFNWTSSDESIVRVEKGGNITALKEGEAEISVTLAEPADISIRYVPCKVTVERVPVEYTITLDRTEASVPEGQTITLLPTVKPATDEPLVWESSDTGIATVDDGEVLGIAKGSAVIKVSLETPDGIFSAECAVTVTEAKPTYKIGQILDFNGVKGIVYEINETGTSGKALSLDESGVVLWATSSTLYSQNYTLAQSEDDGEANCSKLKDLNPSLSYFPAAKWCADLGDGWYLPAVNEGRAWLNLKADLEPLIIENGGKKLGGFYWSSTECEEGEGWEAFYYYYSSSNGGSGYGDFKSEPEGDNYARAVHKF